MPIVNGRLTCTSCGADLGDADDPYRDPDCSECMKREWAAEAAYAEALDAEDALRQQDDDEAANALAERLDAPFRAGAEGEYERWSMGLRR